MSVDLMLLPKSKRNNIAVLVAIDSYSKWLTIVPIKNKTSYVVANALKNNVLPNLPMIPTKILSDNGSEFRSREFNQLLNQFNIKHIYSTPYKPSSNGLVERSNRTIIQLLKGVIVDHNSDWDLVLHRVLITYNNTVHSQINTSPSRMILRESHKCERNVPLNSDVVKTWKAGNPKFSPFQLEQKVLRKIHRTGNLVSDKLRPRYDGPYKVLKKQSNQVTKKIQKINEPDSKVVNAHYQQLRLFYETPSYLRAVVDSDNSNDSLKCDNTDNSSSDESLFLGFPIDTEEESQLIDSDEDSLACEDTEKESIEKGDESSSMFTESEESQKSPSNEVKEIDVDMNDRVLNLQKSSSVDISDTNYEIDSELQDDNEQLLEDEKQDMETEERNPKPKKILTKESKSFGGPDLNNSKLDPKGNTGEVKLNFLEENSCNEIIELVTSHKPLLGELRCSERITSNGVTSTPCNEALTLRSKFCGDLSKIEKISLDAENNEQLVAPAANDKFNSIHEDSGGLHLSSSEASSLVDFLKNNEDAWSSSQEMIRKEMETIKNLPEIQDDGQVFEGFGDVNPYKTIGSARINFLKAYYSRTSEFRESASDYILRNIWLSRLMNSETRLRHSGLFDSVENTLTVKQINFDESAPQRVTRSQGKPMDLPYVQQRPLEYEK